MAAFQGAPTIGHGTPPSVLTQEWGLGEGVAVLTISFGEPSSPLPSGLLSAQTPLFGEELRGWHWGIRGMRSLGVYRGRFLFQSLGQRSHAGVRWEGVISTFLLQNLPVTLKGKELWNDFHLNKEITGPWGHL